LWPNGWMDEDATWYGSRHRRRPHCVRRVPSAPRKGLCTPPLLGLCLLWPRSPISATADLVLPQHRTCTCRGHRLRPLNDFLISTKHLRYTTQYPGYLPSIKPSFNVDSPVQPATQYNERAHLYNKFIRRHGRRQLQSEVEAIASSCFAQILVE